MQLPTGTVTFLFTDIEGSTALLKQLGRDRYELVLADNAELMESTFEAYGGQLVDTQGDSCFVAFRAARDAVAAAVSTQRQIAIHQWPDGAPLKVRMGLHSGEPKASGERYVGIGVHRAARIGSAAHGGQVLLSSSTRELVEEDLPEGTSLRDLGSYRLKDIERPEQIAQVVADGLQADFPSLRGADLVTTRRPVLRRRSLLASVAAGVIAAAIAIPIFAFGGGSGIAHAASLVRLDPAKNTVTSGVRVPGRPVAVTTCAASVFVSNRNGYVYEIDPKTAEPFAIFVGGRPGDIAHIGGLATVLRGPPKDTVTVIDSGTGTASTPFALPGSPAASASIAVYGVDVWIANPNVHRLERVGSPYTGVAHQSISLPPLPSARQGLGYSGLAAGEGALWVAGNDADRKLWRVDPTSRQVKAIRLPFAPHAVAAGLGGVWLVDQADNAVVRFNPKTSELGPRIPVGHEPSAVTIGDGFVWVANSLDGTVSRIDPRNSRVTSVKIGGKPVAIAVGLGAVWVLRQPA